MTSSNTSPDIDASEIMEDPSAWIRLRCFMENDVTKVYDYASRSTIFAARVREENGKVNDIAIMPFSTMEELYNRETYHHGRPWNQSGPTSEYRDARQLEFVFGVDYEQNKDTHCFLITPATYFERTGEVWPIELNISHLLPPSVQEKTAGVFISNAPNMETLKKEMLQYGFIEADALTLYHDELLEMNQLLETSKQGSLGL